MSRKSQKIPMGAAGWREVQRQVERQKRKPKVKAKKQGGRRCNLTE